MPYPAFSESGTELTKDEYSAFFHEEISKDSFQCQHHSIFALEVWTKIQRIFDLPIPSFSMSRASLCVVRKIRRVNAASR